MITCIVIPTFNGVNELRNSVESVLDNSKDHDIKVVVVDNGSYDLMTKKTLREVKQYDNVLVITNNMSGYTYGAMKQAYSKILCDRYLLIHDSVVIKDENYIDIFEDKIQDADAVAWLTFPMNFDSSEQEQWVRSHFPLPDGSLTPDEGVFGSIIYTKQKTLEKFDKAGYFRFDTDVKWKDCGMERGWSFGLKSLDLKLVSIHKHEWSNSRIDQDGYSLFTKRLMHRQ